MQGRPFLISADLSINVPISMATGILAPVYIVSGWSFPPVLLL
jgi:hypothetical protein